MNAFSGKAWGADRDHAVLVSEIDDEEAAAADPGHERLGHPQHRVRGDGSIDGVAAFAQDLDPGARRVLIDARDGAARSDRDRFLRRLRRRGRPRTACNQRSGEQAA
jgi:hypothetical protein